MSLWQVVWRVAPSNNPEDCMANFNFDAVIKIGSMALIRKEDNDLDYNIFARLAKRTAAGVHSCIVRGDGDWAD